MQITGSTRIAGLFGCPVKHTISPKMHNSAFSYLGIDCIYLPFNVKPKDLKKAVDSLRVFNFIGVNVTVPHKQTVMKYLDEITPSALRIGAVNTILVTSKKLVGYNTDGMGFVRSLKDDHGFRLKGKTMFLLGAGGAGRAVAVESALNGLKKIYVVDKDVSRTRSLLRSIPKSCTALTLNLGKDMKEGISDSNIIVNATPVGLHSKDPVSIPPEWIPKGKIVYDVIYNPNKTKLLQGVKNCKTVNGLGMLLYQGINAFEIWTGKKAPVEVMRKAIGRN